MLGAEVRRSMQEGKPRIDLKLGGANIFIAPVAAGDGVNAAPTIPYRGLDHFGLAVSGIDAIAADLKKKGVEFTKEPTTARRACASASSGRRKACRSSCSTATRSTSNPHRIRSWPARRSRARSKLSCSNALVRISRSIPNWLVGRARKNRRSSLAPAIFIAPGRAGSAQAVMRLRALGAVQERSAAMRHRGGRRHGDTKGHRRDHSGHALDHGRAGVSRIRREWRAVAVHVRDARQAVPERSSRSVLQCGGGCGHRARDLPARGRSGRARLLPDQRHPRSCANRQRSSEHAAPGHSGRRSLRRLAGRGRRDYPRLSLSTTIVENTYGSAKPPIRSRPMIGGALHRGPIGGSAMPHVGAKCRSTAGPRTRPGNMPSRRAWISAASSAARAFASISGFRSDNKKTTRS